MRRGVFLGLVLLLAAAALSLQVAQGRVQQLYASDPETTSTATPTPSPSPTPVPGTLPSVHDTNNTRWLARKYPALAQQIQTLSWVQDGLSDLERSAIDELLYMAVEDVANLETILHLPWVQDDITEAEYEFLDKLGYLDSPNPANLQATLNIPWVQDDIAETEYDIIVSLAQLDFDASDVVFRLLSMPFLLSPDTTDALAIRGMENLADGGRLAALTDHSIFEDRVTDNETTLIAAVGTLRDTDEISRVLDPGGAAIETISLGTELTPHLKISIVRTDSQSRPGTIEATGDLIQFIENAIGLPLPVDHVIIMLSENAVTDKAAGTNYGFAFSYLPKYDVTQHDTREWSNLQRGFVHEAAHYFWRGNEDWIDEGLANLFEYRFGLQMGLSHGQLQTRRYGCEAHDLKMLSGWDPSLSEWDRYHCAYYLGQLFFQDLYASMDGETFVASLQEYYRLSLEAQEADRTPGIAEVRKAFAGQGTVIDHHWSGKMNAPENRGFDEGLDRIDHDLVRWDKYPTYEGGKVSFKGELLSDGVFSHPAMTSPGTVIRTNFAVRHANRREYLGSILPPGRNWRLDDPLDVIADSYQLDGQSFAVAFTFPEGVDGALFDYVVTVRGFQDETRTPTIGTHSDLLGYARIRVPSWLDAWNMLDNAGWLDANYPSLAAQIKGMHWVQDGIDGGAEAKALREVLYLAALSRPAVSNILAFEWVEDGVHEREADAIDLVVGSNDPANALSITELTWLQDGIDDLELKTLQELQFFHDAQATAVISMPWFRDGIEPIEVEAIDLLNSFEDSRVALKVIEQDWIQDGIDEPLEVRAIQELSYFDFEDPRLATSLTFDPDRPDLYSVAKSPEHMTNIWWEWIPHDIRVREISFDFTIHSDPGDFSDRHGLYLMVCQGDVADTMFYFGLQTDVYDPSRGAGRGKGMIFSRWNERDLAWTRPAEGGWTQSSGHEGDFIGVRVAYEWGAGAYRMWIRPDGSDEDGEWYGVWIHDYTADTTVSVGSLRFPYDETEKTSIRGSVYTTLEIYGDEIRPIDIPEWYVSMQLPVAGDARPAYGEPGYSSFNGQILNSDIVYDAGEVHFRVGAMTERIGSTKRVTFQ